MSTPGGTITRKDLVDDDALKFGDLLTEQIEKVIKKEKELIALTLEYAEANKAIGKVQNQQDFLNAKQKIIILDKEALIIINQKKEAEIAAEKVKQETIRTEKLTYEAQVKSQQAKKSTIKLSIEERVQNEYNNKVLKQAAVNSLGLGDAYEKLNRKRTEAKNILRDLIASETASTKQINEATKAYERLDQKVRRADAAVGDFTKNVGNYPLKNFTSGLQNLIGAFGVTGGIALFAGIMKGAYETIKKFEQGLADLKAITGVTGKDFEFLKNQAIELGKSTKGGAVAVVEAYKLIASAKPELLDNVDALNQVTESTILLAKASGLDIPEAATKLTDAMNQFGAPASEAAKYVDVLAAGAKRGAAEIPGITDAVLEFGAVAKVSNINIKESVGLVELLAEKGLKGAEAGRSIRNILLEVNSGFTTKEARIELDKYGISWETLKDKTVPFSDKLELLKPLLADTNSIVNTFKKENAAAAISLIDNTDRLRELTGLVGEYGVAEEQAAIRTNTLQGKTEELSATYDSFVLSIGEGSGVVSGFFKIFIDGAKGALVDLIRLNSSWDELFEKAERDGANNGVKLYNQRFNSLIGEDMSDEQRKKISDRVKQLDEEIQKAGNDLWKKEDLNKERSSLLVRLGTGSEADVSLSIAKRAKFEADRIVENIKKTKARIEELETNVFFNGAISKIQIRNNKSELEQLKKALAQENAIIEENNKKVRNARVFVDSASPSNPASLKIEKDDKAEKEAFVRQKKYIDEYLKALKKRNDDEFSLAQFRVEREIYYNELILNDEKSTIQERLDAYSNIENLRKKSADNVLEHELQNIAFAKIEEQKRIFESENQYQTFSKNKIDLLVKQSNAEIELAIKTGKLKANSTNDEILAFERYQLEIKKLNDKADADRQKLIDASVAEIQKRVDAELKIKDTALQHLLLAENDFYRQQLELANGNNDKIQKATIDHEKAIFDIKKKAATDALQLQIGAIEKELQTENGKFYFEQISVEKRAELNNKLAKYKVELSNLESENYVTNLSNKEEAEKQFKEKVTDLALQLKDELINLTNAIFDSKIAKIDDDIQANNDYYENQIERAGDDARKKDLLEKEKAKKNDELQKKKRKVEYDAAIFSKVMALADIGIKTAQAIAAANLTIQAMNAISFGTAGTDYGAIAIPTIYAMAGIQAAVVLATPLPKYKDGRKDGPAENAIVGDGGIPEIITGYDGSNPRITPSTPTFARLEKGDIVHKSMDDYNKYIKASILGNISIQNNKMNAYQAAQIFDIHNEKLIDEMQEVRKAIKNQKLVIHNNMPKIDIEHAVWAANIKKWNN